MNVMGAYWARLYKGTPAELSIEPAIAALSIPYRTQFPMWLFGMGKFFPDVLLPTIGVVVEIDDDSHNEDEKKAADALRTAALEKLGYVVVRISNEEALRDPVEAIQRLIVHRGLLLRKGPGLPQPAARTRTRRRGSKSPRSRSKSAQKSPSARS